MTDKLIKEMLESVDLDLLTTFEITLYNRYRQRLPKFLSVYKIISNYNDLSDELQEIKYFTKEYEKTIKI
jgi:hypothetical protein